MFYIEEHWASFQCPEHPWTVHVLVPRVPWPRPRRRLHSAAEGGNGQQLHTCWHGNYKWRQGFHIHSHSGFPLLSQALGDPAAVTGTLGTAVSPRWDRGQANHKPVNTASLLWKLTPRGSWQNQAAHPGWIRNLILPCSSLCLGRFWCCTSRMWNVLSGADTLLCWIPHSLSSRTNRQALAVLDTSGFPAVWCCDSAQLAAVQMCVQKAASAPCLHCTCSPFGDPRAAERRRENSPCQHVPSLLLPGKGSWCKISPGRTLHSALGLCPCVTSFSTEWSPGKREISALYFSCSECHTKQEQSFSLGSGWSGIRFYINLTELQKKNTNSLKLC